MSDLFVPKSVVSVSEDAREQFLNRKQDETLKLFLCLVALSGYAALSEGIPKTGTKCKPVIYVSLNEHSTWTTDCKKTISESISTTIFSCL